MEYFLDLLDATYKVFLTSFENDKNVFEDDEYRTYIDNLILELSLSFNKDPMEVSSDMAETLKEVMEMVPYNSIKKTIH